MLKISRIILFVNDVKLVAKFYEAAFGLKIIGTVDPGWTELSSGNCSIGFHKASKLLKGHGYSNSKIVFGTKNVAFLKTKLEEKGIKMGKIISYENILMCDGKDPEGNPFQISDRGMK